MSDVYTCTIGNHTVIFDASFLPKIGEVVTIDKDAARNGIVIVTRKPIFPNRLILSSTQNALSLAVALCGHDNISQSSEVSVANTQRAIVVAIHHAKYFSAGCFIPPMPAEKLLAAYVDVYWARRDVEIAREKVATAARFAEPLDAIEYLHNREIALADAIRNYIVAGGQIDDIF